MPNDTMLHMDDKIILVRARVISEQDHVLTCLLEDGFGTAQVIVHQDKVVATL